MSVRVKKSAEAPHPLGDRVYSKHDAMIDKMARSRALKEGKKKVSRGVIVREAIEEKFYRDMELK